MDTIPNENMALPPISPQMRMMPIVLNSDSLPVHMAESLLSTLTSERSSVLTMLVLFPRVGTYSMNGTPLLFGVALGLLQLPSGQIAVERWEHDDINEEPVRKKLELITDPFNWVQHIQNLWYGVYHEAVPRLQVVTP